MTYDDVYKVVNGVDPTQKYSRGFLSLPSVILEVQTWVTRGTTFFFKTKDPKVRD